MYSLDVYKRNEQRSGEKIMHKNAGKKLSKKKIVFAKRAFFFFVES